MKEKTNASGLRFWILVWGLGIAGQLCWNIENQWFNTFVYAKIAKDPTIISWMVAISAIATILTGQEIDIYIIADAIDGYGFYKGKELLGVFLISVLQQYPLDCKIAFGFLDFLLIFVFCYFDY